MLDNPEKTVELLARLRAALPFEVMLTPELIDLLSRHQDPVAVAETETVCDLSYAGDEGGIVCQLKLSDRDKRVFASLTHVRVPRALPFAKDVLAYQKHRVKKLRKQQARGF